MRRPALVLGLSLLASACAGGGSSSDSRCGDACDRDEMCNFDSGSPFCDDECQDDTTALRGEFADAFFTCYADLSCDLDGTDCEVQASAAVDRRTLDDQFQAVCQAKQGDCLEDSTFSSDFCFVSHYYQAGAVDAANDCIGLTCPEIGACLQRELPFAPFDR
jgi:hypothetical protein